MEQEGICQQKTIIVKYLAVRLVFEKWIYTLDREKGCT